MPYNALKCKKEGEKFEPIPAPSSRAATLLSHCHFEVNKRALALTTQQKLIIFLNLSSAKAEVFGRLAGEEEINRGASAKSGGICLVQRGGMPLSGSGSSRALLASSSGQNRLRSRTSPSNPFWREFRRRLSEQNSLGGSRPSGRQPGSG